MALTYFSVRRLQAGSKPILEGDEQGLYIEVWPSSPGVASGCKIEAALVQQFLEAPSTRLDLASGDRDVDLAEEICVIVDLIEAERSPRSNRDRRARISQCNGARCAHRTKR